MDANKPTQVFRHYPFEEFAVSGEGSSCLFLLLQQGQLET